MSHKPLPPKLEDDLNSVKHYKPSAPPSADENAPNGTSNQAFRRRRSIPSALQNVFDDSVERSMYDEIFGHILPKQRVSQNVKFAAGSGIDAIKHTAASAASPGDSSPSNPSNDFITNLLQRLRLVEKESKEFREKLAIELVKNESLTKENAKLKQSLQEPGYLLQQLHRVQADNKVLQQKLTEMEEFLADYGLSWVCYSSDKQQQGQLGQRLTNDSRQSDSGSDNHDTADGQTMIPSLVVSYADFNKAVQELNSIIYREPSQVVKRSTAARLVQASETVERIQLTFYGNGLLVKAGPFRLHSSESYASFVQDILDGYFPQELKEEHPQGCIFDLVDRHADTYPLGGAAGGVGGAQMTMKKEQFLQRLPKHVISAQGEVISIRGDLQTKLTGDSSSATTAAVMAASNDDKQPTTSKQLQQGGVIVIKTAAWQVLQAAAQLDQSSSADSSEDQQQHHHSLGQTVKIHVKMSSIPGAKQQSSSSSSSFLVHLFEMNTISELCQTLLSELAGQTQQGQPSSLSLTEEEKMEVRNAYPSKVLSHSLTLLEAGLVPNGTVHLRLLP